MDRIEGSGGRSGFKVACRGEETGGGAPDEAL